MRKALASLALVGFLVMAANPVGAEPYQRLTGPVTVQSGNAVLDPTCPLGVATDGQIVESRRQVLTGTVDSASGSETITVDACIVGRGDTRSETVEGTFSIAVRNNDQRVTGSVDGFLGLPPAPPWFPSYNFFLTLQPDHGPHDLFLDAFFGCEGYATTHKAFLATSRSAADAGTSGRC